MNEDVTVDAVVLETATADHQFRVLQILTQVLITAAAAVQAVVSGYYGLQRLCSIIDNSLMKSVLVNLSSTCISCQVYFDWQVIS